MVPVSQSIYFQEENRRGVKFQREIKQQMYLILIVSFTGIEHST